MVGTETPTTWAWIATASSRAKMEDRTDHTERHQVADDDGDDHQPATAGDEKSLDCPFRLFGVSRHHHSEVEQRGFLRAHDTHDPALEDHPLPAEHEILGGAA